MYINSKSQPSSSGAQTSLPMMHPSGYSSGGHAHGGVPVSSQMSSMTHLPGGYSHAAASYGFKVPENTSHSLPMYSPIPVQKQQVPSQAMRPSQHSPHVVQHQQHQQQQQQQQQQPHSQSPHLMLNSHMTSPHPHVSVPSPHLISPGSRRTPHSPHLRSPSSSLIPSPSQPLSSPSPHMSSHHPHLATPSPRLMSPHSQSSVGSHSSSSSSRLHSVAELSQSSIEREAHAAPLDLSTTKPLTGETRRIETSVRSDPARTDVPRTDAPLDLSVKPVRKRDHEEDDDVIVVGSEQHIPFKARRRSEYTSLYPYPTSNMQYMSAQQHPGYVNGNIPTDGQVSLYSRHSHPDHRQSRTPSRSGVIQSPQGGTVSSYYSSEPTSGKASLYHRQQLAPNLPPGSQQMSRSQHDSGQQRLTYPYASPTGTPYKLPTPSVSRGEPIPPQPTTTSSMGTPSSEARYHYPFSHSISRGAPLASQHHVSISGSSAAPRYIYPAPVQPGGSSSVHRTGASQSVRHPSPLINPNTTSGLSIPRSPRTVQDRTVSYQQPAPSHHVVGQRPPSSGGSSSTPHVIGNNTPGLAPTSPKQMPHGYPQQKHYSHPSPRMMTVCGPSPTSTGHSQWPPGPHHPGSLISGKSRSMTEHGSSASSLSTGSSAGSSSVSETLIRASPRGTLLRAESPRTISHPPSPSQSQIRQYPHPSHSSSSSSSSSSSTHIDLTRGIHLSVPRPSLSNPGSSVGLRPNHFSEPDLRSMSHSQVRTNVHPTDPGGRATMSKHEMGAHTGQQMVRILPFQQTSIAQPVRVPQPGYLIRPHEVSRAPFHGPHSITVSLNPNQFGASSSGNPPVSENHQQQACITSVAPSTMASVTKPWPGYSSYPAADPASSRHHLDIPAAYCREDGPHSVMPVSTKKSIPVANVNPIIVQPKSPSPIHPKKLMLYQSRIENSPGSQQQQLKLSSDNNNKQGIVSTKTPVSDGSGNNVTMLLSEALHSTFKRMLTSSECEVNSRLKSESKPVCNEATQNGDNSGKLDFSKLTRGLDKCPEPIVKTERDQIISFTENVSATELKIPVVPLKERMKPKDHFGRSSPICPEYKKKPSVKKELELKKPKLGRPRLKPKCKEAENAKIHRYYKVKSKVNTAKVKNQSGVKAETVTTWKKEEGRNNECKSVHGDQEYKDETEEEEVKEYDDDKCEQVGRAKPRRVLRLKEDSIRTGKKKMCLKTGARKQKVATQRKDGKRRKESSGVVITARTRNQTAATKGVRRLSSAYNKNAAYERELKREEYRKLIKRFKRQTRQLGNRESRRVTRERLGVIFQSDTGSEEEDANDDDVDDEDEDEDEDLDDEDEEDTEFVCKQIRYQQRKSDEDDYEFEDSASEETRVTRAKRRYTVRNKRGAAEEENLDEDVSEDDEDQGSTRDQDLGDVEESQEKREQVQLAKKTKRGMRGRGRIFRRRGAAWYDKKRDRKKKIRVKEENESPQCHDAAEANDIAGQEVLSTPEMARRLVICKETGETLLHKAARLGHDDVVLYCLENGFEVNSRDNAGYTPLHETCVRGHVMSARILIAHGADINANAHDGTRPMHDAVDNNNTEIVRILLACGVDTKLVSFGGRNVMKLAKGDAMKEVLRGYFGDLNGANEEKGFEEIAWRFYGSQTSEDASVEKGFAILDDPPSDPEDDDLDLEFDLSDVEHLPMFYLETVPNKGPCNYHVLYDVLRRLQMTQEEFVSSYPDVDVIEHYAPCLQHVLHDVEPVPSTSHGNNARRKVPLVEATYALRSLLGVETETVSWRNSKGPENKCLEEEEVCPDELRHDDEESCCDDETSRTESPGPTETVLDPVNGFLKTQKVKNYNQDYQGDEDNINEMKTDTTAEVEKPVSEASGPTNVLQVSQISNAEQPSESVRKEGENLDTAPNIIDPSDGAAGECDKVSPDKGGDESTTQSRPQAAEGHKEAIEGEDLQVKSCDSSERDDCASPATVAVCGTFVPVVASVSPGGSRSHSASPATVAVCGTYVPVVTSVTGDSLAHSALPISLEVLTNSISEVQVQKHTTQDLRDSAQAPVTLCSDLEAGQMAPGEKGGRREGKPKGEPSAASPAPPKTPVSSTEACSAISPVVQLGRNDNDKVQSQEKRPCSSPTRPEEGKAKAGDDTAREASTSNKAVHSPEVAACDSVNSLSPRSSDLAISKGDKEVSVSALVKKALPDSLVDPAVPNHQHHSPPHLSTEPGPSTCRDVRNSPNRPNTTSSPNVTKKGCECAPENGRVSINVNGTWGRESEDVARLSAHSDKSREPPRSSDNVIREEAGIVKAGGPPEPPPPSSAAPKPTSASPPRTAANCDIDTKNKAKSDHKPKQIAQPAECRATTSNQAGPMLTATTTTSTTTTTAAATTSSTTSTTTAKNASNNTTILPSSAHTEKEDAPSSGEVRKENNNNNVAEETPDSGLPVLEKHETEGEEEAPEDKRTVEPSSDETSDDREMPKLTIQAY